MRFSSHRAEHRAEQRRRRYPLLSVFDVATNVALCVGVFAFGCAVLGLILIHNSPSILVQIAHVATRF